GGCRKPVPRFLVRSGAVPAGGDGVRQARTTRRRAALRSEAGDAMSRPTRVEAVWSIDDLELELRKLPGVRSAGFDEFDDVLLVQLHVMDRQEKIDLPDRNDQPVPVSASRIAARHSDRPVTVEIVRWRNAPPVEPPLLAPAASETVETNKTADTDEIAPDRPVPRSTRSTVV